MPNERVRFQGDPVVGSTVPPGGKEDPRVPLSAGVQATQVEMLEQDEATGGHDAPEVPPPNKRPQSHKVMTPPPAEDEDEDEEEGTPGYERESIGARVGLDVDQQKAAVEAEKVYDTEDCKACLFPVYVQLQHEGIMHKFQPGVHLVPVSIAGATKKEMHWWLKNNKVRQVGAGLQPNPRKDEETVDE